MTRVDLGSTAAVPGRSEKAPSKVGTRGRTEHMGPLVHELITWDLVVRSDSGEFVLLDDVQQKLGEALAQAGSTPDVFVGRPCEACNTLTVTRLVDGSRVCGPCRQSALTTEIRSPSTLSPRHSRPGLRKWRRLAV